VPVARRQDVALRVVKMGGWLAGAVRCGRRGGGVAGMAGRCGCILQVAAMAMAGCMAATACCLAGPGICLLSTVVLQAVDPSTLGLRS
jgi:hypothetical protein